MCMDTFSWPKINRGKQLHPATKISFEDYPLRKLRNLRNFSGQPCHSAKYEGDRQGGRLYRSTCLLGMAGKPEVEGELSGLRCSPGLSFPALRAPCRPVRRSRRTAPPCTPAWKPEKGNPGLVILFPRFNLSSPDSLQFLTIMCRMVGWWINLYSHNALGYRGFSAKNWLREEARMGDFTRPKRLQNLVGTEIALDAA